MIYAQEPHTVTITDNLGCVITETFSLVEPPALALSTAFASPLCFGSSDGSIALTVTGGTANYSYLWDDIGASITQDISRNSKWNLYCRCNRC